MCPASAIVDHAAVAKIRQPLLRVRHSSSPSQREHKRIAGGDPQHRRGDALPDRATSSIRYTVGKRQLVARIGAQPRAAVGQHFRPVRGEKLRLVARQARIVLLQAIGDGGEVRIRRERRRIAQRVEPLRVSCPARARGVSAGMPKPSSETTPRDALRPHAGVDASRRCRRGCVRRDAPARPARNARAARRDRRGSRRTSSRRRTTRSGRSRASRARSRTSRARARRPETGTTRRRPSSRAA